MIRLAGADHKMLGATAQFLPRIFELREKLGNRMSPAYEPRP